MDSQEDSARQEYSQEISEVAYAYWESRGHDDGHDVEDWLTAEQEVIRRHLKPASGTSRVANAA